MKDKSNEQIAMSVSAWSIVVNVVLSAFKLFAGIFARSYAMISDAVHSASDVLSTVIVMVGVKISGKKADVRHPYGHERFECIAAIVLAVMLAATGIGIGYAGVKILIAGNFGDLAVPGVLALVAAAVSIVVKEGMYWVTRSAAKKINSGALMADAWHHRSDALSSVGSFCGILGALLGVPVLDPIASIVICVFILKAAIGIFVDAIRKMTDESAGPETEEQLRRVVLREDGVWGIDLLHTRRFGDRFYVEVEIRADGEQKLRESHEVAERVHDAIERAFPLVKHVTVHVNPALSSDETEGEDQEEQK